MTLMFLVTDTGDGTGSGPLESFISLGALTGLLVGYFFAVSRRPALGGMFLVVVPLVAIWVMRLWGGEEDSILFFLALPLMLAPFAVSWRSSVWIFTLNLMALVTVVPLTEWQAGEAVDVEDHLVVASFIAIVSVLALIAARAVETDLNRLEKSENALRAANEQLRELDRSRLQFVNNVAHDLASPIHPVRLQLAVLDALPEINPEQKRKSLGILNRNVDQFERLLNDLRDVSKLEAGRLPLQLQEVDVASLLSSSCEGFTASAAQRGLQLECRAPTPLPCVADPQRVTQVIYNLVTNALKFTTSGGTVKVSALASGPVAEIRVTDTGRGLSPEERAKLFRPFSQVHDPTLYRERGTGLGLFICKGLVEAHGGSIGVLSDGLGKGSTFWFTLPLNHAPKPASPASTG